MINLRSLRVRLSIWYVIFTMSWMSCIGFFSWLYLHNALATSRINTMERREHRLLAYMNDEWKNHPGLTFEQQFDHYLEARVESDVVEVFDLSGNRIYPVHDSVLEIAWPGSNCIAPCFGEITVDHHRMRTLSHIVDLSGQRVRLCVAGVVDEHYDILDNVLYCYLIAFPLMLTASISMGFLLSRRALDPVDRITRDARTIGIHDLSRRLPVPDTGDELQRLTETWNELLTRLDSAVNKLTQFTSDISHDLRTSTSVMLSTAQVALRRERAPEDYRTALNTIALECQATETLLNDLLTIARTETEQPPVDKAPVNLAEVLEEVCDQMRVQALLKFQQLVRVGAVEAWVLGNLSLLRRLTAILLDNAVKYTPEYGMITVSIEVRDEMVHLDVIDTGIGITTEDTGQIFDRFFRGDRSRGRENGGKGLGLAIARWIADTHGAEIRVSSAPGQGSVFTVSLQCMRSVPESTPLSLSA
jgi:two-component system heavy metal sensor histidine kinase CusS